MGSHFTIKLHKKENKRSMISLGVSVLILLAQTPPPAECQIPSPRFHAYADDFGQMYTVDKFANVMAYGPFIKRVAGKAKSVAITSAFPSDAKYLAVIASNKINRFTQSDPAGFLL